MKLRLKIHQDLSNLTTYEGFVCFSTKYGTRVHLQNNTFIFRKVLEISVIWTIKILQNRRFERRFFILRYPAPLIAPVCRQLEWIRYYINAGGLAI